jgi:hypothetical protein
MVIHQFGVELKQRVNGLQVTSNAMLVKGMHQPLPVESLDGIRDGEEVWLHMSSGASHGGPGTYRELVLSYANKKMDPELRAALVGKSEVVPQSARDAVAASLSDRFEVTRVWASEPLHC